MHSFPIGTCYLTYVLSNICHLIRTHTYPPVSTRTYSAHPQWVCDCAEFARNMQTKCENPCRGGNPQAAQSLHNASVCLRTVRVAFSCASSGYPYLRRILFIVSICLLTRIIRHHARACDVIEVGLTFGGRMVPCRLKVER